MPAPVFIVGAGAVGLTLAARLAGTRDVTVIARGARAERLADEGFRIVGAESHHVRPRVLRSEDRPVLPSDAVVISAVKATQLQAAHGPDGVRVGPGHTLVLCQNGIGLEAHVGPIRCGAALVRAACWFGAALTGDSEVTLAGIYQLELASSEPSALAAIDALFAGAGLPVRRAASVKECEWRKSLWNLAVSGPTALLDQTNGAILDDPGLRALADDVLAEARAVAAAEGVTITDEDVARVFASTERTRSNRNAMVHDLRRGGPTEMGFLNAAVARLARQHGLPAPANTTLARLVLAAERPRVS